MLPNYISNYKSKNEKDEWMWSEQLHNQVALHNHTYHLIKNEKWMNQIQE